MAQNSEEPPASPADPGHPARAVLDRLDLILSLGAKALTLVAVAAAVVVVAVMAWSAKQDKAIVVSPFHASPGLIRAGFDGEVLAAHFLDQLAAFDARARDEQYTMTVIDGHDRLSVERPDSKVADVKIDIPHTGISIDELQRFFTAWLGHETQITGDVVETPRGYFLTVRSGDAGAIGQASPALNEGSFPQAAIEKIYGGLQPALYANHLIYNDRWPEAVKILIPMATSGADRDEKAWSSWELADMILYPKNTAARFDVRDAIVLLNSAIALRPGYPLFYDDRAAAESMIGQDEKALADTERAAERFGRRVKTLKSDAVLSRLNEDKISLDEYRGDFVDALNMDHAKAAAIAYRDRSPGALFTMAEHLALLHEHSLALRMVADAGEMDEQAIARQTMPGGDDPLPTAMAAIDVEDWDGAYRELTEADQEAGAVGGTAYSWRDVRIRPWLAYVEARLGRGADAMALINSTDAGCYLCARMRGKIAGEMGRWSEAAAWAGRAIAAAPSLPFAFLDRGDAEMAMRRPAAALADYRHAADLAPKFADALERCGEADASRGDYASANVYFERAAALAPHWGRLNVAWAQALDGGHRGGEAAARYRQAAQLDLSPEDAARIPPRLR